MQNKRFNRPLNPGAKGFLALGVWTCAAHAASGDLDSAFGNGGKLTIDFANGGSTPDYAEAHAIVRDGAGDVYVVGDAAPDGIRSIAIAKVDAHGNPVATFGTGGKAVIDTTDVLHGTAAALDASGNVLVIGGSRSGTALGMSVTKVDSNGHKVTDFGTGGSAFIDLHSSYYNGTVAIAVDPGGPIYAAGNTDSAGTRDMVVVKLDASGQPVASFGNAGKVLVDFAGRADSVSAIVLDGNGHLALAGETDDGATGAADMAMAKLDTDGNLVSSFGTEGRAQIHIVGYDSGFSAIARDVGGNLYGAGYAQLPNHFPDFAVAEIDVDGHLVGTFGDGGTKVLASSGNATDFAIVPDIALGPAGNVFLAGTVADDFRVLELDANGAYVTSFGTGGVAQFCFSCGHDRVYAMTLDGNSHLYVAGYTFPSDEVFAVAKLEVTPPDPIFANGFEP
jgi:uncharacterized delta-60 repeat protein